ncbi:hypothetical protein K470DRAFT_255461 [Piedraia hortae CBS 480.64]|uniref:Uncharacterized protein n=1 Tax=Piedraia hortae CBS 480.64 TaxID=1314780 RepID=A0A6A7C634_9PEZI|nr:hypothetical protein K470DRAFT_255461 [Piedraia hortae CBS 480.64]
MSLAPPFHGKQYVCSCCASEHHLQSNPSSEHHRHRLPQRKGLEKPATTQEIACGFNAELKILNEADYELVARKDEDIARKNRVMQWLQHVRPDGEIQVIRLRIQMCHAEQALKRTQVQAQMCSHGQTRF